MPVFRPDPTFYPSPRLAMEAPREGLAYVALLRTGGRPDGFAVVDVGPRSATYGRVVHTLDFRYLKHRHLFQAANPHGSTVPVLPGNEPVPASRFLRDRLPDDRSSVPSTGVFRLRATPGDGGHQGREIPGCVFVPVEHEAAFLTAENTLRKRQRQLDRAAP